MMTWREQQIKLEGAGSRPCLTAKNSYLPGSCSLCDQPCILAAGHPTQKARDEVLRAQQREERRLKKVQGKTLRGNKMKTSGMHVYPPLRKSPRKASVSA